MELSKQLNDQCIHEAIFNFLYQNGYTEEDTRKFDSKICIPQPETLQHWAIGISAEKLAQVNTKLPSLYIVTGVLFSLLLVLGVVLLFLNPYFHFIEIGSLFFITWCMCCISMIVTNIIAILDWKKRHEKPKK